MATENWQLRKRQVSSAAAFYTQSWWHWKGMLSDGSFFQHGEDRTGGVRPFQHWMCFARGSIASLSVSYCGSLFLVWLLVMGNHDCSLSEYCFRWHWSGECWNIREIISSSSCKTFFTPKDTEKPAQLWAMRVQLRIGANPFIRLAQIPQADRSMQFLSK